VTRGWKSPDTRADLFGFFYRAVGEETQSLRSMWRNCWPSQSDAESFFFKRRHPVARISVEATITSVADQARFEETVEAKAREDEAMRKISAYKLLKRIG